MPIIDQENPPLLPTLPEVVAAIPYARERGAVALDSVPLAVLDELLQLQAVAAELFRVAAGEVAHSCNHSGAFAPECPACRVLIEAKGLFHP